MKTQLVKAMTVMLVVSGFMFSATAEETTGEKLKHTANKAEDSVKETYRNAADKTCEMINGKMECLGKKVKRKAQTAADKTATKVEQLKNKVDNK